MRPQFNINSHYLYLVETVFTYSSDECLIWPFGKDKDGYGRISIYYKDYRAHRVAYGLFNEKPCVNLTCHTCDNPPCYNPRHLFDGTNIANCADMKTKDRSCRGERCHLAKFNAEQVLAFRKEFAEHGSCTLISRMHGISLSTIEKIIYRNTWRHI